MIHLYTGNGKGKTTAATGLCIRAAGWNLLVCFAQFMKGNDTGELHVLKSLPGVTILRSEKILELVESGNCHLPGRQRN